MWGWKRFLQSQDRIMRENHCWHHDPDAWLWVTLFTKATWRFVSLILLTLEQRFLFGFSDFRSISTHKKPNVNFHRWLFKSNDYDFVRQGHVTHNMNVIYLGLLKLEQRFLFDFASVWGPSTQIYINQKLNLYTWLCMSRSRDLHVQVMCVCLC